MGGGMDKISAMEDVIVLMRNGREPQQVQGGLKESGQGMAGGSKGDLQEPRKGNTRTKHSPGFSIIFFKLFFLLYSWYMSSTTINFK